MNETLDFSAKKLDIIIERDTTLDFTVTWQDASGTAINLINYTARMQIKPLNGTSVTLELISTANTGSRLIKNNATGDVRILLLDNDSVTIPKGDYSYDLVLYGSTEVKRLIGGQLIFKDFVTATP